MAWTIKSHHARYGIEASAGSCVVPRIPLTHKIAYSILKMVNTHIMSR